MSLVFGGAGVYPQLTIPNWPSVASLPLSFFCWTYQVDDNQLTPIALADAGSLGCLQIYDYNSGTYAAYYHENWWDRVATVRATHVPGWAAWGSSFPSPGVLSVFAPLGGVGTNNGGTDHNPGPYTRLMFARDGVATEAVAEIAVWNYALTTADMTLLAAGRNPTTIQPSKLLAYLPLRTDVKDYGPSSFPVVGVGGWTATYGGTHPPVDAYSTTPPPSGGHTPQFAMVAA
jgi:hypothetical protein